jgi:hypothetical protein
MARRVLQDHDAVVHEHPYGKREPAQGHGVDRLSGVIKRNEPSEDRERQGEGDDQRGADAA